MPSPESDVMPMSPACTHGLVAERDRTGEPLNPARGILLGCLIGAGLWLGLVALVVG